MPMRACFMLLLLAAPMIARADCPRELAFPLFGPVTVHSMAGLFAYLDAMCEEAGVPSDEVVFSGISYGQAAAIDVAGLPPLSMELMSMPGYAALSTISASVSLTVKPEHFMPMATLLQSKVGKPASSIYQLSLQTVYTSYVAPADDYPWPPDGHRRELTFVLSTSGDVLTPEIAKFVRETPAASPQSAFPWW